MVGVGEDVCKIVMHAKVVYCVIKSMSDADHGGAHARPTSVMGPSIGDGLLMERPVKFHPIIAALARAQAGHDSLLVPSCMEATPGLC
jgi:hypothetical protein